MLTKTDFDFLEDRTFDPNNTQFAEYLKDLGKRNSDRLSIWQPVGLKRRAFPILASGTEIEDYALKHLFTPSSRTVNFKTADQLIRANQRDHGAQNVDFNRIREYTTGSDSVEFGIREKIGISIINQGEYGSVSASFRFVDGRHRLFSAIICLLHLGFTWEEIAQMAIPVDVILAENPRTQERLVSIKNKSRHMGSWEAVLPLNLNWANLAEAHKGLSSLHEENSRRIVEYWALVGTIAKREMVESSAVTAKQYGIAFKKMASRLFSPRSRFFASEEARQTAQAYLHSLFDASHGHERFIEFVKTCVYLIEDHSAGESRCNALLMGEQLAEYWLDYLYGDDRLIG